MADENQKNEEVEETLDLPEVQEGEEDTTDWKSEAQKLREKAIAQRERTKALKEQLKEAKEKELVPLRKEINKAQQAIDITKASIDTCMYCVAIISLASFIYLTTLVLLVYTLTSFIT